MMDDVQIGLDGWLFLKGGSNDVIRYYTDPEYFHNEHLDRWVDLLSSREKYFTDQKIKYLHLVAPEKISVFPEKYGEILPHFDRHPLARLECALRDRSQLEILVNPLKLLREKNGNIETYYRTDTHWTIWGAYQAYLLTCERLSVEPAINFSNERIGRWPGTFDLGEKLSPQLSEDHMYIAPSGNFKQKFINDIGRLHVQSQEDNSLVPMHHGIHVIFENNSTKACDRTVVIFGDSFSDYRPSTFTSLMAETFREVHFIWSNDIDFDYIKNTKVDIVISEIAERFMRSIPTDHYDVFRFSAERMESFMSNHPEFLLKLPKIEKQKFSVHSRVTMEQITSKKTIYAQERIPNRFPPIPAYEGQNMLPLMKGMERWQSDSVDILRFFPEINLNLHEIDDGYFIIENGLDNVICDSEKRVISESAYYATVLPDRNDSIFLDMEVSPLVLDNVFLGFDSAWHNYYHFLALGVGRTFLADQIVGEDVSLIIPDYSTRQNYSQMAYSEDTYTQILRYSGLENRVTKLPVGIYKAKKIQFFWPSLADPVTISNMNIFDEVFSKLRSSIPRRNDFPRRLFLSRERGNNPRMTPEQIQKTTQISEEFGFSKVFFEDYDFLTQAQMIMNAEAIVAPHGAGLVNTMLGNRDLVIMELNSYFDGGPLLRSCFFTGAAVRGQRYLYLNGSEGDFNPEQMRSAFAKIDQLLRRG